MPSPRWSAPAETPVFQALAAAQHAAWNVSPEHRRATFTERFRQLTDRETVDRHLAAALTIFDAQSSPPAGYVDPPANMHFACCPNCQRLNAKAFSQAPNGRVKLNALRDRDWLDRQLANGQTAGDIANRLGCTRPAVNVWIDRHGLERRRLMVHDDEVAALHDAGLAPGEISRKLDVPVDKVRGALKRTRAVTNKEGHHYFRKEWWTLRVVEREMTTRQCAADAGIAVNACPFWLKRFGLSHITAARSCAVTKRRPSLKYPQLADAAQLQALMEKHRSYEQVSLAIAGKRTSAGNVKNWWLYHFGAPPAWIGNGRPGKRVPHSDREWWTTRLDRGDTMQQIADELGIVLDSVRERLRAFGGDLLARGYANNTKAERAKRSMRAAASWARPRQLQEGAV